MQSGGGKGCRAVMNESAAQHFLTRWKAALNCATSSVGPPQNGGGDGLQCGTNYHPRACKSGSLSASKPSGLPRQLTRKNISGIIGPLIDDVIRTGQAVVVPDISAEPSLKRKMRREPWKRWRSFACR